MVVKRNGQNVVLPDIPEKFLARYPYYVVGYQISGEFYVVIGSYNAFFHRQLNEVSHAVLNLYAGGITRTSEDGDGNLFWVMTDGEITEDSMAAGDCGAVLSNNGSTGVVEFLWANHDIHEYVIYDTPTVLDDIWYLCDSEQYQNSYVVTGELIKNTANIARAVAGETKRYTPEEMIKILGRVSDSKGVEF